MKLTRRDTLTLAALAAASAAGIPSIALAKEGDVVDMNRLLQTAMIDKVLGDPNAPVTLIEYASPTCPHCAVWSNEVLEPLKEKYISTGQVKLIVRPFARNTLDVAIFMLAEAAARSVDAVATPPADTGAPSSEPSSEPAEPAPEARGYSQAAAEAYDNVLAAFFRTQPQWSSSNDPLTALKQVTAQFGFSEDTFNEALTDQALFEAISTVTQQAVDEFGLEGTPTFYVNGKQLTGGKSLEALSAEIDPLL